METNLKYINQICIDLGGVGGHVLNIDGENEICTLLGGEGGHSLEIDALNEICTIHGVTAGHVLNLSALNAIAGDTFTTNIAAWSAIQQGGILVGGGGRVLCTVNATENQEFIGYLSFPTDQGTMIVDFGDGSSTEEFEAVYDEGSIAWFYTLSHTYLSAGIYDVIINIPLTNLAYLNLFNNQLTEVDLTGLTNLEELNLFNNQLTISAVDDVLTQLSVLYPDLTEVYLKQTVPAPPTPSVLLAAQATNPQCAFSVDEFLPSMVDGLVLFLEADSLILTDGDPVDSWVSSDDLYIEATQTGTNRPTFKENILNGKPVIRFDKAASQFMSLGTAASLDMDNNLTTIIVYDTTIPTVRQTVLGCFDVANGFQLEFGLVPNTPNVIIEGVVMANTTIQKLEGFSILTYIRRGATDATHEFYQDGFPCLIGTKNSNNYTATGYTKEIGRRSPGNQHFDGDIAAIIQYNTDISYSDLVKVELYLANKYGLNHHLEKPLVDFSIIEYGDTQEYVDVNPSPVFNNMTQFASDYKTRLKLSAIMHGGDITLSNTTSEIESSSIALSKFPTDIPTIFIPGNHDYDNNSRVSTTWNSLRGQSFYTSKSWFDGGFYESNKSENLYIKFTAAGSNILIIGLEFGARQGAIDWANGIIQANPTYDVIFLTHCYSYDDGTRTGTLDPYNPHTIITPDVDVHDGDELWTELVSLAANDNIIQTYSGHQTGFVATEVTGISDNKITEILHGHTDQTYQLGSILIVQIDATNNNMYLLRYNANTGKGLSRVKVNYK